MTIRLSWCAALFGALSIIGCTPSDEPQSAPLAPPEHLLLVHSPEVSELIERSLAAFTRKTPRLPNGAPLSIERTVLPSLKSARLIARGEKKPTLFIAPTETLVHELNQRTVNLGAPHAQCKKLFSTEVVGAISRERYEQLKTRDEIKERMPLINFVRLGQLQMTGVEQSDTALVAHGQLFDLQRGSSRIGLARIIGSETQLLSTLSHDFFRKPRIAITSEQNVIRFNLANTSAKKRAQAVYLEPAGPQLSYSACISQADWVTAAQRSAAILLQQHLLEQETQIIAQQLGFRSDKYANSSLSVFSPEHGVATDPSRDTIDVSRSDLAKLFQSGSTLGHKRATVYIVDCSGSMSGAPIQMAKRLVRAALDVENPESTAAILELNTDPRLVTPFSTSASTLAPYLLGLEANGGSALYDAILLAAETLQRPEFIEYQRRVVLITDGNDQSSKSNLSFFSNILERRAGEREVGLSVFFIETPGVSRSDLEQITELMAGQINNISLSISSESFLEILAKN